MLNRSFLVVVSILLSISLLVQSEKEIVGTLWGFDEYVNMVLDDVTTIDYTPTGQKESKLNSILLNGANVALLCRVESRSRRMKGGRCVHIGIFIVSYDEFEFEKQTGTNITPFGHEREREERGDFGYAPYLFLRS